MKAISKRLERLETLFAPRAAKDDDWGSLASVHDELLRLAARFGEPRCSEITAELDALGPAGLWNEAVRTLLADHGYVQTGDESLAETVARSLDMHVAIAANTKIEIRFMGLLFKLLPAC